MADPARRAPTYVRTLARVTHRDAATAWQESYSYSDGFEREIQRKLRAEPGPLVPGGPSIPERWVGSGWTVYNNHGKPVRRYEPFFDDTPAFAFARQEGVSPVLFYDPADRVVGTLRPDHTYEKVVFDPWSRRPGTPTTPSCRSTRATIPTSAASSPVSPSASSCRPGSTRGRAVRSVPRSRPPRRGRSRMRARRSSRSWTRADAWSRPSPTAGSMSRARPGC